MQYRMTVDNSRLGITYVLDLIGEGGGASGGEGVSWRASWRAEFSAGERLTEPSGALSTDDAYEAFRKAKRLLEDLDEDIIDVDWQFKEPLPPWLME